MWLSFSALVLSSIVIGIVKTGSVHSALVASAWISPLLLFACYFASRRSKSASMAERVLAGFWLLIRRVVCFFAAAFFLMVSVFGGMAALKERSGFGLLGVIFALVMAAACTWWGLYGAGRVRTFGDARSTHEERKRRYGWK